MKVKQAAGWHMHDAARAVGLETPVARIIRFYQAGGPEVLRLEETAAQRPGSGEVLLRVQAAGLNRAEALFVRAKNSGLPHSHRASGAKERVLWKMSAPMSTAPG